MYHMSFNIVVYLVYPTIVAIYCCQCSSKISPFLQDVKEILGDIEKYSNSLTICSSKFELLSKNHCDDLSRASKLKHR